jgi:hypothetical protein
MLYILTAITISSCTQFYGQLVEDTPLKQEAETIDYIEGEWVAEGVNHDKELKLCCSVFDFDKNQLMRCWTANNRCDICYDLCETWTGNNLKPTVE